ncbi:uncharacterized protein LOC121377618 isoform X2 [Gigantopelta aegis]|uniref:uncharacterized protein LOC121377618 isoform X2 n=1 Tax=Gigantopelta aegis TaxID=1735272 RepID=UPI001B88DD12|nr:uncharacterized protein LOC121377618 isoform X2 [Gigantopelta aegis]
MRELFTSGCLLLLCCIEGMIGEDHRTVLFHGRGRKNWALGKRTHQSSTFNLFFYSKHAVDGSLSNDGMTFFSCMHTKFERHPWWIVDLQVTIRVKEVYIMNRGDCCGKRLKHFHIDVHKGNFARLRLVGLCHYQSEPLKTGIAKNFRCPYDLIGQFVRLWIDSYDEALNVCEVEVYGSMYIHSNDPSDGSWALNMPAWQSTLENGYKAVDGNYNNMWVGDSCSHTRGGDKRPYWQVDLLQMLIITSVKLYNRKDCCGDRLHDFRIDVYARTNNKDPHKCNEQKGSPMGLSRKYKCFQDLLGRIVRVTKTKILGKHDVLTLCEVEVFGWKLVSDPEYLKSRDNFAIGQRVWQSAGTVSAKKAVDGNLHNNDAGGTCSLAESNSGGSTWWKVMVGTMYVEAILLVFRVDCCENQAPTLQVWVDRKVLCGRQREWYKKGAAVGYPCPPNTLGHYVLIMKGPGTFPHDFLALCEVEVYGNKEDKNWALGAKASVLYLTAGGKQVGQPHDAPQATDGDFSNSYSENVCPVHTGYYFFTLVVDLDASLYVDRVVYQTAVGHTFTMRKVNVWLVNTLLKFTNKHACNRVPGTTGAGQYVTVKCKGYRLDLLASRVMLKNTLRGQPMLICEVEVYGKFAYFV